LANSQGRLTPFEFADALHKGKGRVVAHLRHHGDAGVEPELMAAFRTNLIYDQQCEGSRSAWFLGLLDHVADSRPYRDAVLEALQSDDDWDLRNAVDLAVHFARDGDEEMRQQLFARFDTWEVNDDPFGHALVELDIDAFLQVARGLVHRGVRKPDLWFDGPEVVEHAKESLGAARVEAALAAVAGDPDIIAFLAHRDMQEPRHGPRVPGPFEGPGPVDRGLAMLEESRSSGRGLAYGLGKHARSADIDRLIEVVEGRPERRQLLFCLRTLGRRTLRPHYRHAAGFGARQRSRDKGRRDHGPQRCNRRGGAGIGDREPGIGRAGGDRAAGEEFRRRRFPPDTCRHWRYHR